MRFTLWMVPIWALTAACGGGGGGENAPTVPGPSPGGGGTLINAAQSLLDDFADPISYTALSSIPTSGSATYTGYAYGDLADTSDTVTDTLMGELEMSVTFTNTSAVFSGQIEGFEDENGDPLSGTLALSDGSLDRSGSPTADSTVGVTVSGTLTDASSRTLTIGGRLEGDFLGTGHAAIGGEFLGSVTISGSSQNLDGGFIASR